MHCSIFELEKQYDMSELIKCSHRKWLCQFSSSTEALSLIQNPHGCTKDTRVNIINIGLQVDMTHIYQKFDDVPHTK